MVVHPEGADTLTRQPSPLDGTLAALAEPTRRQVVELLRGGPRRASDIAQALGMSRPAMSRHLRVLREAGLIHEEGEDDDARARVYHLERARLAELRGWLDEVEGFWTDQLEAFKEHVEAARRGR